MLLVSRSKRGQDRQNTRERRRTSRVFQGSSEQCFIRYVMNKRYNDRGRTTAAFPPTTKFSRLYVSLFRTSWSVGRDKIIPAASEPRTAGNSLNL